MSRARFGSTLRGAAALACVAATVATGVLAAAPADAYVEPPAGYVAIAPQVALDTLTGFGAPQHPLAAHQTVTVSLHVPASGATGFELTLTATNPSRRGHVTAWPAGTPRPTANALAFNAGETITGDAFVPGSSSVISIFNASSGTVDVTAVLTGFTTYTGFARGAGIAVVGSRILDTANGLGASGPIAPGATLTLQVTGHGGIPISDPGCPCVDSAAITFTAVSPTASGYVLVGNGSSVASPVLQLTPGRDRSNMVWAALSSAGTVAIHNVSSAPLQLLADADGYNVNAGAANAGGQLFAGTSLRLVDTRSGVGGPASPLPAHGTRTLAGLDPNEAYLLNVTLLEPTKAGAVEVYTSGTSPTGPAVSITRNRATTNLILGRPNSSGQVAITNTSAGTVQLVIDAEGTATGCC